MRRIVFSFFFFRRFQPALFFFLINLLEKCGCAVAILYAGFMHDACNQKARSVSEKVPFASLDLLGGTESPELTE